MSERDSVERIRAINTSDLSSPSFPHPTRVSHWTDPMKIQTARLPGPRVRQRRVEGPEEHRYQRELVSLWLMNPAPTSTPESQNSEWEGCGIIGVWLPFCANLQAQLCFSSSCHFSLPLIYYSLIYILWSYFKHTQEIFLPYTGNNQCSHLIIHSFIKCPK